MSNKSSNKFQYVFTFDNYGKNYGNKAVRGLRLFDTFSEAKDYMKAFCFDYLDKTGDTPNSLFLEIGKVDKSVGQKLFDISKANPDDFCNLDYFRNQFCGFYFVYNYNPRYFADWDSIMKDRKIKK